jgi:hypothetical protein
MTSRKESGTRTRLSFAVGLVFAVVACSSSSTSTFTCKINGVEYTCPDQASYDKCASSSSSDPSGCTRASSSSGNPQGSSFGDVSSGSTSSGGGSSSSGSAACGLFSCKAQKDCGFIAPCLGAEGKPSYCYEQAASASACPAGNTTTTVTVNGRATTICVRPECPKPEKQIP